MPVFNPPVQQTQDPNWLWWSKPISEPKPDLSNAASIEAVGEGIGASVKGMDWLFKTSAETETYDKTRALQDEYKSSLEKADITTRLASAAQGGGTPAPGAGVPAPAQQTAQATDIMAGDQPSQGKPKDLQNLPQSLEILGSARGNNKLSETAYYGRLDALAKDLRARYPGYREYIDKEMERVSGVNAANKYITSLLGDINSFANAGKEEHNKIRNQIWDAYKMGIPGAAEVLKRYEAGQLGTPQEAGPKIMEWAGPAHTLELQLKLAEMRRKNRQGVDADLSRDTEDMANKYLQGQAFNYFNSLHLMQGAPTPDKIMEIIRKANAGEISLDDKQGQALGQALMTQKAMASAASDEYFNKEGADGRTIRSILGQARAAELKTAHLQRFDEVKDLIYSKEYGRAHDRMNSIRAMGDDDKYRLLNDTEMGQFFRLSKTIDTMGLDKYTKEFFQGSLGGLTSPQYSTWLKNAGAKMLTQPDGPAGVVTTLKGQVEDLQKRTGGAATPTITKTYDGLLSAIEFIADPKNTDLQSKYGLAKAAFDPSNIGLLNKFEKDTYEHGVYKPGKYSVFNRLFSEDMTRTVKQLGGTSWTDYKDLAKQLFGRELFGPELKQFSEGLNAFQNNKDLKIGWDSDNHQFVHKFSKDTPPSSARDNFRTYFTSTINRINFSLSKMANIAKEEGSDVDAYLLGVLKEHGVDTGKLPGIPQKMMEEIIRARTEEETNKASFKQRYQGTPGNSPTSSKLNYDVEQAPPSGRVGTTLGEFLSNPAGTLPASSRNAPTAARTRPRGTPASTNLSDTTETGRSVVDVPEGADINQYLRR